MQDGTRQLVVCCDGTNDTLAGVQRDTNVLQLVELLTQARDPGQRLYYDPGVGSPEDPPAVGRKAGLAQRLRRLQALTLGRGIYDNIDGAYRFLCREYRPGDQIWLFGYSRGAFTVRAVSGMVSMFGLMRPEFAPLLPALLRIYFAGDQDTMSPASRWFDRLRSALRGDRGRPLPDREQLAAQVRELCCQPEHREVPVQFVGAWDTVESVGLRGFRREITSRRTLKGTRIVHARHALSLDEHRLAFQPRYYEDHEALDPGQTLKQLWFRGAHVDVGGAAFAPQAGLARGALDWMLGEARQCGLRLPALPPAGAEQRWLVQDQLHASPWWAVLGMSLRDTRHVPGGNVDGLRLDAPAEHPSAARVPDTLWAQWRSWGRLTLALGGTATVLVLSGRALEPAAGRGGGLAPASWPRALAAGGRGAWDLQTALWQPGAAWDRVNARRVQQGASPLLSLGWDLLAIGGYGYLLARLSSRSFVCLAGWRHVGQPMPLWARLRLGQALPTALLADLAENACAAAALGVRHPLWSPKLMWAAGLASAWKWAGLAGVAGLALSALVHVLARRPRARRVPALR